MERKLLQEKKAKGLAAIWVNVIANECVAKCRITAATPWNEIFWLCGEYDFWKWCSRDGFIRFLTTVEMGELVDLLAVCSGGPGRLSELIRIGCDVWEVEPGETRGQRAPDLQSMITLAVIQWRVYRDQFESPNKQREPMIEHGPWLVICESFWELLCRFKSGTVEEILNEIPPVEESAGSEGGGEARSTNPEADLIAKAMIKLFHATSD